MASSSRRQLQFIGRGQPNFKKCSYRGVDGNCNNYRALLQKDGHAAQSPYCGSHCCYRMTGQIPCNRLRAPQTVFCHEHLRCTSEAAGHQCPNYVKAMSPGTFRFCAAAHNCKTEGCSNECVYDGTAGLGYCGDHRCYEQRCDRPAVPGSRRCAGHTCEAPNCLARVPGGDPGSVDRFCERHRICGVAGCGRFTFTRDTGQACLHCGNHYCHTEGCDAARQGGGWAEHCAEHTCVEPGCHKGLERARSSFCKSHGCKKDGCLFRRRLGDWCIDHKCARPNCDGEALAGGYCERHMVCNVAGCDNFRLPDGDGRCDDHSHPRCQKHRCSARAVEGGEWCVDHVCRMRNCTGLGRAGGGFCDRHRCSAPYCLEPRATMQGGREYDGHAYDDDGALAPFCSAHCCRRTGCMQQTARDGPWCPGHVRYGLGGYEVGESDDGPRWRERELDRDRDRPRYQECPVGQRRHHTVYPDEMLPPVLRPSRHRTGIWPRRGYGRDMDDEWRWPQGI